MAEKAYYCQEKQRHSVKCPMHNFFLLSIVSSCKIVMLCMTNQISHISTRRREAGTMIRDIDGWRATSGYQLELLKMAASLRILAKGKLSTMQPALRAIFSRPCPAILSRGLSLTSELDSPLFVSCRVGRYQWFSSILPGVTSLSLYSYLLHYF